MSDDIMTACAVDGCERRVLARRLCSMHYQRVMTHGDPGPVGSVLTRGQPMAERLAAGLVTAGPDECWVWTRSVDGSGYGQLKVGGSNVKTHRLAYELAHGAPPGGLQVLHRCDNPPCCNPAHLFLGTHADNMADRDAKRRTLNASKTHCVRGHEYTSENTITSTRGWRECRACRALRRSAAYRKAAA